MPFRQAKDLLVEVLAQFLHPPLKGIQPLLQSLLPLGQTEHLLVEVLAQFLHPPFKGVQPPLHDLQPPLQGIHPLGLEGKLAVKVLPQRDQMLQDLCQCLLHLGAPGEGLRHPPGQPVPEIRVFLI